MLVVVIIFGLILAGALLAAGWLHWRGTIRFGQRNRQWGLTTIALALLQVVAWLLLPGPPDLWLRPTIALAAALVVVLVIAGRRRAA
jgi:hypothetical protein